LVRGLLREGVERVVVVDSLLSGKRENLAGIEQHVEFHQLDVRHYDAIEPLFAGVEVVFHEAGLASVPRSIEEPLLAHDINVGGTLNVFLAAQRQGVRRVVYAASSSAYGDSPELPKTETLAPQPKSPYAVQKLTGEYYARVFWEAFGLETVSLRYFNAFGPRQDPGSPYSGVLSLFSTCVLEGRAPTIFGDGEQSRDFIYVDDIVRLNLLAASSPQAPGKVYNAGTGKRRSLNEAWSVMQAVAAVDLPARYAPERSGDVRHSQGDISRARRDLGFEPAIEFEEGLRRTLEWYRQRVPV
jgi:UDP-glucose 4-epimerase